VAPDGVSVVFSCSQGCIVLRVELAMVVCGERDYVDYERFGMVVNIDESSSDVTICLFIRQGGGLFNDTMLFRLPTNRVPSTYCRSHS
jgi:hypothetical protein